MIFSPFCSTHTNLLHTHSYFCGLFLPLLHLFYLLTLISLLSVVFPPFPFTFFSLYSSPFFHIPSFNEYGQNPLREGGGIFQYVHGSPLCTADICMKSMRKQTYWWRHFNKYFKKILQTQAPVRQGEDGKTSLVFVAANYFQEFGRRRRPPPGWTLELTVKVNCIGLCQVVQ